MEVARLRAELTSYIDRRVAQIFGWTLTAKSSALGENDAVETADDDADPTTHQKGQRPVTRVLPFGMGSRPPARLRSLWLRLGASNVVFVGIAPTEGYGPQDLDVGETAIYNAAKTIVRLWKSGKLTLDADATQSADVVVNGGTQKVGRVGDTVDLGKWSVTITSGAISAISVLLPGTSTPVTIATSPAATALSGQISSGADHFKG
jgi:hypothetical protein